MLSRQMIDWERSTRTDHRVRHINGILSFVDVSLRCPLMHALDHQTCGCKLEMTVTVMTDCCTVRKLMVVTVNYRCRKLVNLHHLM